MRQLLVKDIWLKGSDKALLLIIVLILSLVLGTLSGLGEVGLYVALVGPIFLMFTLLSFQRPMLVLYGMIVTSASVPVFREIAIPIGNTKMTMSGFVWIFFATLIGFSLLIRLQKVRVPPHIWPFLTFAGWVVFRWIVEPTGFVGLKDVLWYSMPVLVGLYVPLALGKSKEKALDHARRLEKVVLYSVFISAALYAIALSTGLAKMTWRGPRGDLVGSSRGLPLYLLVVLSVAVANWRYSPSRQVGRVVSLFALGIILFSLARMASLLALGLIVLRKVNPRRKWQIVVAEIAVIIVAFYAITNIPILQQRFFFVEDWSIDEGLKGVHTAGRNIVWPVVYMYAIERPVMGWGLGTARQLVATLFVGKKDVTEYHPHNEYLQAFHDLGLLGVGLLVVSWGMLLIQFWRRWEQAANPSMAKWNMAAAFAVSAVVISLLTDNTLHYPGVIVPSMIVATIADLMIAQAHKAGAKGAFNDTS